ncbi:replication initiation negative regulator SeqA [Thalassotalea sp. HSM 43]|uniref:replication initiation negative regulator SeqA n=1 Tax=Thalassotalea sp. HSM 43 TaxID=2552945 RepID=UPI001080A154|nr:replication initiation negative regulator SeqA [Thalassotalea sp. HSM 43]QBY05655.1 replication initiation negative regulator SeqA [Thalassotalea sp. HSM 43]
MKTIEIDDELYQYIASNTKYIGESASDILRRLLEVSKGKAEQAKATAQAKNNNNTPVEVVDTPKAEVVDAQTTETTETVQDIESDTVEKISVVSPEQNLFDLINKEELAMQRGAVGRFLLILSNLYRVHKGEFEQVLDIRGRDRLYFAKSEEELREYGSSTKPKLIPNSNYWVITNSNTTKKKRMLTDVAIALGYTGSDSERIRELL